MKKNSVAYKLIKKILLIKLTIKLINKILMI